MNILFETRIVKNFKKAIKRTIRRFGYDICPLSIDANDIYHLCRVLIHCDVNVIFDIGANIGQFSIELRSVGYGGKIISFEPLEDAHRLLSENAKGDSNWIVHPRLALSNINGETEINVAGNSLSSSILNMMPAHANAAPNSSYIKQTKVNTDRFDNIFPQYITEADNWFIKIDTQGFEWQVLDGSELALAKCKGLVCELSLVELYENQRLWLDVIQRLNSCGFKLWSIQQGFTDKSTGQTLQVDAIFVKIGTKQ